MSMPNEPLQSYLNGPNPFYNKGLKVQSIFWPCSVFAVNLHLNADSALNLFEKAVLKLADQAIRGERAADMLCLDENFFRFVESRLIQLGYLMQDHTLTEKGRDLVNGKDNGEYQMVYMYREEVSGALLPYCVISQPPSLQSDSQGPFFDTISNKRRIHSPRFIYPTRRNSNPPSEAEVQKALGRFVFKSLNVPQISGTRENRVRLSEKMRVKIQPDPHFLYLHCVCSLGADGRSILVWDPFGYNVPEQTLIDALANSKDRAEIVMSALANLRSEGKRTGLPEPGFVKDLPHSLRPIYAAAYAFKMIKEVENSSDMNIRRSRRYWGRKYLENTCSALEGFFLEMITRFASKNGQSYLESFLAGIEAGDIEANRKRMLDAAQLLHMEGLKNDNFAVLDSRGVNSYLCGRPNLRALFSINLLLAQLDLQQHPFSSLAESFPDLIGLMHHLYLSRNAFMHSDMEAAVPEDELLSTWFRLSSAIYKLLNPGENGALTLLERIEKWIFERVQPSEGKKEAEAEKKEIFTAAQINALPQPIYEKFLEAEREFTELQSICPSDKDAKVMQTVMTPLGGFLEMLLRQGRTGLNEKIADPLKKAVMKAQEAGFAVRGELPLALRQTSSQKIAKALSGKKETLGAEAISWLLCQSQEYLLQVAERSPRFLEHLADAIELRGHGREEISAQAARDCAEAIFQDCQGILDLMKGV